MGNQVVFYALTTMFLSIRSKRQFVVIAIAVGIGCVTEASQLLVTTRHADALDLIANFAGTGAALTCWMILSFALSRHQRARQR